MAAVGRYLEVSVKFDAAHQLKDYPGKCNMMHGHTWKVVCLMEHGPLTPANMSIDFKEVKRVINAVLPDHECLNIVYKEDNPTAEFLAEHLYYSIRKALWEAFSGALLELLMVKVYESEDCAACFQGRLGLGI